jgi:hypothetical protein
MVHFSSEPAVPKERESKNSFPVHDFQYGQRLGAIEHLLFQFHVPGEKGSHRGLCQRFSKLDASISSDHNLDDILFSYVSSSLLLYRHRSVQSTSQGK